MCDSTINLWGTYASAHAARRKTTILLVAPIDLKPGGGSTTTTAVLFAGFVPICCVAFQKCMPYALVNVSPSCCTVYFWGMGAVWDPPYNRVALSFFQLIAACIMSPLGHGQVVSLPDISSAFERCD